MALCHQRIPCARHGQSHMLSKTPMCRSLSLPQFSYMSASHLSRARPSSSGLRPTRPRPSAAAALGAGPTTTAAMTRVTWRPSSARASATGTDFPVKGTSPNTRSVVCATVCRPQALPLITLVPSPSGRSSAPRASSSGYWRSPDVTQIRCGHPAHESGSPPARPSRTGSRLGLGVRLSVGTRDLLQLEDGDLGIVEVGVGGGGAGVGALYG